MGGSSFFHASSAAINVAIASASAALHFCFCFYSVSVSDLLRYVKGIEVDAGRTMSQLWSGGICPLSL